MSSASSALNSSTLVQLPRGLDGHSRRRVAVSSVRRASTRAFLIAGDVFYATTRATHAVADWRFSRAREAPRQEQSAAEAGGRVGPLPTEASSAGEEMREAVLSELGVMADGDVSARPAPAGTGVQKLTAGWNEQQLYSSIQSKRNRSYGR